jgi:hypothetical protein
MTVPRRPAGLSDSVRAVLDRMRRDSDRLFGSRRAQISALTFQVRESSEVARVRVATSTAVRHVFVKVFKPRPGEIGLESTRTRFRRDYDVTRRVFEAMTSLGELRAVEPIACYEDLLAVVTNEVAGLPLSVAITKNAAWPTAHARLSGLEMAVSRVGRWVAAFQRVAPHPEPSRLDLDAIREYVDTRLTKLVNLPRASFGRTDRLEILSHFDRCAADVRPSDLVEVPVHGDIVPSNVVVAPECITVLDFGMTARGSRYLDISRLYTQLQFYTAKPQYRPAVITSLQQAALYAFDPGLRADHPLFEICAIQHVICHLLSHARTPGPFPASLYSRHQCRRHRRWLRARTQTAAVGGASSGEAAASPS